MERRKKKSLSSSLHFFPVRRYLSQQVSYVSQQWRTSVTDLQRLVSHFSVFTTFWRHLWPITEQTQGNMESVCLIVHFTDSKKSVLEEIITIYKLVGQRENFKSIYIPFFMYTVTPLVRADISWISTHLPKSFPLSMILKNRRKEWRFRKCVSLTNILYMLSIALIIR